MPRPRPPMYTTQGTEGVDFVVGEKFPTDVYTKIFEGKTNIQEHLEEKLEALEYFREIMVLFDIILCLYIF